MDAIDLLGKHDHDLARQSANHLIRECAVPRFSYLLRGVRPDLIATAAARHDNRVSESLGKLMGPHNLLSYGMELSEADMSMIKINA